MCLWLAFVTRMVVVSRNQTFYSLFDNTVVILINYKHADPCSFFPCLLFATSYNNFTCAYYTLLATTFYFTICYKLQQFYLRSLYVACNNLQLYQCLTCYNIIIIIFFIPKKIHQVAIKNFQCLLYFTINFYKLPSIGYY